MLAEPLRQHRGHFGGRAQVLAPDVATLCRADPHAAVFVRAFDTEEYFLFGFVARNTRGRQHVRLILFHAQRNARSAGTVPPKSSISPEFRQPLLRSSPP